MRRLNLLLVVALVWISGTLHAAPKDDSGDTLDPQVQAQRWYIMRGGAQVVLEEDFTNAARIAPKSRPDEQVDVLPADVWRARPSATAKEPLFLDWTEPNIRPRLVALEEGVYVARSSQKGAIALVPKSGHVNVFLVTPPVFGPEVLVSFDLSTSNSSDGFHVILIIACVNDQAKPQTFDEVSFVPRLSRSGPRTITRHVAVPNKCGDGNRMLISWSAFPRGEQSIALLERVSILSARSRPTVAFISVAGNEEAAPFLQSVFAAKLRDFGLYNVVTCGDDVADEALLVDPLAKRGWENVDQAGDRGAVLAALTSAGCRIPPYSSLLAARLAVYRDPQTHQRELVVTMRRLDVPLAPVDTYIFQEPQDETLSWNELVSRAVDEIRRTQDVPATSLSTSSANRAAVTTVEVLDAQFASYSAASVYVVMLACDSGPSMCDRERIDAMVSQFRARCGQGGFDYAAALREIDCLLTSLRAGPLRVVREVRWANWLGSVPANVETVPTGALIRVADDGADGYAVVAIPIAGNGRWDARPIATDTTEVLGGWVHTSLGYAYRYSPSEEARDRNGSGILEIGGSVRYHWAYFGLRGSFGFVAQGSKSGSAVGSAGNQVGAIFPVARDVYTTAALAVDYASPGLADTQSSVLLGIPLRFYYALPRRRLWWSPAPHSASYLGSPMTKRRQRLWDSTASPSLPDPLQWAIAVGLEPFSDASFSRTYGLRFTVGVSAGSGSY